MRYCLCLLVSALQDAQSRQLAAKRRLNRRDTEEAVERVIAEKLAGKFSEEAINGATNASGQTVREFISENVRELRGGKKHLSTSFWSGFFQQFALRRSECDLLPVPTAADEVVRDEVFQNLRQCHDPNPAMRSVEPLVAYLRSCPRLSHMELYGLINGCQECPTIVRSQYWKLMMAILGYIARRWGRLLPRCVAHESDMTIGANVQMPCVECPGCPSRIGPLV